MRLTQQAIKILNTSERRPDFQIVLKKSEATIKRMFQQNKENGPLTTAAALSIAKKVAGLSENEVLES